MGAIITLDYVAMTGAYKKANAAADTCDAYARKIDQQINQKITTLRMGGNSNTLQANYFAKQKIAELDARKAKYNQYSIKMKDVLIFANNTDEYVSFYIRNSSRDFRDRHDMKVGVITEFLAWITTTILNSDEFGRWLKQIGKDVGAWIDKTKRKFKIWFELKGGKYYIRTALNIILALGAIVALVVSFSALLGILASGIVVVGAAFWQLTVVVAGIVSSSIIACNCTIKAISNSVAYNKFEDNPGWAKRYSSYSSLADYLHKNNFNSPILNGIADVLANIIERADAIADLILVADLGINSLHILEQWKNGNLAKMLNKIYIKSPKGKVTKHTIKYAIKRISQNQDKIKKLLTTTDVSRLYTYYKKYIPLSGVPQIIKGAGEIVGFIEKIGNEGSFEAISDKIKDRIKKKLIVCEYVSKFQNLSKKVVMCN